MTKTSTRRRKPTLFDALGYSMRPHRPGAFATLMVSLAVVFHFGLLVILWQEARGVPTIVWTATSLCLLSLAAIAARNSSISLPNVTSFTIFFCVAYPIFGWLSYAYWGKYSSEREALLLQTVPIIGLGLALYFVGCAARSHRTYTAIGAAWCIIALYSLLNYNKFDPQSMYQDSLANAGLSLNYQQLGDAFAITSVILAPRIKNTFLQWAFIAVAIVIMFIIPSRSAAFFGTFSLVLTVFLFGSRFTQILIVVAGIVAALGYSSGMLAEMFEGTRFESVFTPDTEDGSWSARQEIMDYGMAILTSKPFTGEWAFQLSELKFSGYYIHNALDVWAQTGLIPFLIFMGIWAYLLIALINGLSLWPRIAKECLPVLTYAALSWTLARNIGFVALFFCVGFASASLAQARYGDPARRRRRSRAPDMVFAHTQLVQTQFAQQRNPQARQAGAVFNPETAFSYDTLFHPDAGDNQGTVYNPDSVFSQDNQDPAQLPQRTPPRSS